MNIIFLRGAVPPANEHPEKLLYNTIDECEDMWTQLFYHTLCKLDAKGQLLYKGRHRKHKASGGFMEVWTPSFATYKPGFIPDVIICRGGFKYYDQFISRFPEAKKIYYGAGKRFYPSTAFTGYDLFLVDSKQQLKQIRAKDKRAQLFIKPAATLFKPVAVEKEFDVCFAANAGQFRIKRHGLFLKSLSRSGLKVLHLGNNNKIFRKLAKELEVDITYGGWSLRGELPPKISRCKVGVCCSTNYDSCPRVIPEYLACGLPVVATSNMHFWHDKYINSATGVLSDSNSLSASIRKALVTTFNVSDYYDRYLSMNAASSYFAGLIRRL